MTNTIDEKEVKVLEKEIAPYVKKAEGLVIKDQAGMNTAAEILSNINKYADTVQERKESVTKPLNAALKAFRTMFAPLEDRLDGAVASIRRAMTVYQTEQKKIADAEAAKIAARVGEGKGKLKVETAVKKMEEIDKPDAHIKAESGSVKFQTVKKFEVMDVTMLPHEYVLPNEVKIRTAMKAGIELPGVRYYEEQNPINTR